MIEDRKADRVRVLGVQVDPVRADRAVNLTVRYLEKHKFEYIVFANTPAALLGREEAGMEDYIDHAALVLPGDANIEDAVEARAWLGDDRNYQAEYFRRLFTRLNKQRASIYLMVDKEEQLSKIHKIMKEKYNRFQVESILWQEDASVDGLVNSINSHAPDILFICASHEKMSHFLREHACKINAGLCVCMEEVVTDTQTDISDWMHFSKMQKMIFDLKKNATRFLHDILFKKQMKQISQAEEAENGLEETEPMEGMCGDARDAAESEVDQPEE